MPESLMSVVTSRVSIDTMLSGFDGVVTTSRFTSLHDGNNDDNKVASNNMTDAVRTAVSGFYPSRMRIP